MRVRHVGRRRRLTALRGALVRIGERVRVVVAAAMLAAVVVVAPVVPVVVSRRVARAIALMLTVVSISVMSNTNLSTKRP